MLGDPARRPAACAALGAMRQSRAVPALLALLEEPDAATRVVAARALGDIRDPSAVEGLVNAAGDPDVEVRDAAIDALNRLGSVVDVVGSAALVETLETRLQRRDAPRALRPGNGLARRPGYGAPDWRAVLQRLLGRDG
jgi:HEAT repeat protein